MMITKDEIKRNEPFLVKWSHPLKQEEKLGPGYSLAGQSDQFLTRLEKDTSIIKDSRFIKMKSIEENIDHLRVKVRLQNTRKLSGLEKGGQITNLSELDETKPLISQSTLKAGSFTAYTYIPKNFLLENIEKEGFINSYESLLIPSCAYSSEVIGIYGKETNEGTDGIHAINGLLKQLEEYEKSYQDENDPKKKENLINGFHDNINLNYDIVPQLIDMVIAFLKRGGRSENARFKVSTQFMGELFKEVSKRETNRGDEVYFDGKEIRIFNIPFEYAQVLDNPENGYSEHILLGDFDSFAFGYLDEINSENTYEHTRKSYLTSVDVYFATAIINPEDIIASRVVKNEEPTKNSNKKLKNTEIIEDKKSDNSKSSGT